MRTDSHGHRQHSRHSYGDTSDEKHQQIVNTFTVLPLLDGEHHNDLDQETNGDRHYAKVSDGGKNLYSSI